MIAYQRLIDALHREGCYVRETGHGKAEAQTPGHSSADRSLSIRAIEGQVLVHCHSDPTDQVLDRLGLRYSDLFDNDREVRYEYPDARVVRRFTREKKFSQTGNTAGKSLYRADRLAEATVVYYVEGEKDVHAIEAEGGVATCNAQGAGKAHLFDLTPLYGKTVIVVRDDDAPGHAHAAQVAELLAGKANVQIVESAVGKDAADHVAAGRGLDDFIPVRIPLADRLRGLVESLAGVDDDQVRAALYRELDAAGGDEPELRAFGELAQDWINWVDSEDRDPVIPTPWGELDDYLAGGLHAGRSYLVAARPGAGKSLALLNIAAHAAAERPNEAGRVGAVFSVEMGAMEVMSRIMAAGAGVDYGQLTRRRVAEESWTAIMRYANGNSEMPLFVCDSPELTIEAVRAMCRRLKQTRGLDFVAVDYVQLMKPTDRKLARERQVSEISWGLKMMAKELNVAVVSACQLNRAATKENRPPDVSELRESGSLEQDADVVLMLHHPKDEGGNPTGTVDVIIGKNRTGQRGSLTLDWNAWKAKIG